MTHIPSYPSVYALGHKALEGLFEEPVLVEEKIDGSQFSFGVLDGELCARSKGKDLVLDAPEKMFTQAVETARSLQPLLTPGYIYRCEYLQKPKHNTLEYSRIPAAHLILYDVTVGPESYGSVRLKEEEAAKLGLELVPAFFEGTIDNLATLHDMMERESCLGGVKLEGVVLKNYTRFTKDKKPMMAKYVREEFKEQHAGEWKKSNPTRKDIVLEIIDRYKVVPRWEKAVQHLRDAGKLVEGPQDIGALITEVPADVLAECEADIKEALFNYAWPQIRRGITAGLPQWYKERLARSAF